VPIQVKTNGQPSHVIDDAGQPVPVDGAPAPYEPRDDLKAIVDYLESLELNTSTPTGSIARITAHFDLEDDLP
jgi:hypothetical protein